MEITCNMEKTWDLADSLQDGLLKWYPFREKSDILYVSEVDTQLEKKAYDYIVVYSDIEKHPNPLLLLAQYKEHLKPDGHLLLAVNNRLGIRYFCGDRDPYTERNFDSIENYRRAYVKTEDVFQGRMYAKAEWIRMLCDTGWKEECFQFFSVFTDLRNPTFIYSEDVFPNEDLVSRLFPTYNYPQSVFLEEEALYQSLIDNGMFHQMANAYLIECAMDGNLSDASHVTCSMDRGKEHAMLTIIHKSGIVEKKAAYPEGRGSLQALADNMEALKQRGISVVEMKLVDGVCRMPYVKAETGHQYLKRLLMEDKETFFQEMDHFRDLLLKSSDIVGRDEKGGKGVILEKGFFEMIPFNSFHVDGEFVFFDQELCEADLPANLLILRMIVTLYAGAMELQKIVPMDELFARYGILENKDELWRAERDYLDKLLNKRQLRVYHEKCRRNPETVNANRLRMNYSESEYQRLFVDVFKGTRSKKLILFGSGVFAREFVNMYGKEYPVYAIVDNNEGKWGQVLEGVTISSPEILKSLDAGEYKVVICIKNYLSVMKQLDELGVKDYSVFDPGKVYPREQQMVLADTNDPEAKPKKYHVGYVAGVFDMFHVGHVNLLRRAKELCDYLIVGVLPDEEVYLQKQKYPMIPCEDRVEVVRACRYADRVEALPVRHTSIRHAYRLFHFDVQFSGDDHGENIDWLADWEFLKKNGADIVFFPYTEKVSSTKIREQLLADE